MSVRAVILAAGQSRRMGTQKLLLPFRGKLMVEHTIEAAREWNPLVVAGPDVARALTGNSHAAVCVNDAPSLGMSHSLALADAALDPESSIVLLLADKPLASAALIRAVCERAGEADVVYPIRADEPGHPVFLSVAARRKIASLPRGDTLQLLRDDPSLLRLQLEMDDLGAYLDIDTPEALNALVE
ncbi:MAG: nucleotidyltransferase family protein [Vulcanimicrobiaceae bacterium]